MWSPTVLNDNNKKGDKIVPNKIDIERCKREAREYRKRKSADHFVLMKLAGKVQGPLTTEQITRTTPRRQRLLIRLQQIAVKRDGQFLGVWRENNRTIGRFICHRNHSWNAVVENIIAGSWCWNCGHNVHDDEDCRKIAEKRGGKCLRTWQERGETYGEFVCGNGHPPWIASASRVIERSWCLRCAIDKMKIGIECCKLFAKEKGGECLSTEYINASSKLHWRCSKGHDWWARWAYVNYGYWCSSCSKEWRFKRQHSNIKRKLT